MFSFLLFIQYPNEREVENVLEAKEKKKKDRKKTNSQNKHASQRVNLMKVKSRGKLILAPRIPNESSLGAYYVLKSTLPQKFIHKSQEDFLKRKEKNARKTHLSSYLGDPRSFRNQMALSSTDSSSSCSSVYPLILHQAPLRCPTTRRASNPE